MLKKDKNLASLPFVKSSPTTLKKTFNLKKKPGDYFRWIADMDYTLSPPIEKALIKRIKASSFGYVNRPSSFFSAMKIWYQTQYGFSPEEKEIIFSPSIPTSLAFIIEEFSNPEDGVVIQPPVYMAFKNVIKKCDRMVVRNSLKEKNGYYEIDFIDLEKKLQAKKNKLLIFCSPHNPVGRAWTKKEIQKVVFLCEKYKVILIADEIHKDFVLFNHKFHSVYLLAKKQTPFFIVTSEAKTFNMSSIGESMVITKNHKLLKKIVSKFSRYSLFPNGALSHLAVETSYTSGQSWVDEIKKNIEENILLIKEMLKKNKSKIKFFLPESLYLVWLDFREVLPATFAITKLIEQTRIFMIPGHWFGREGWGFIRLNIATTKKEVKEIVNRIIQAEKYFSSNLSS